MPRELRWIDEEEIGMEYRIFNNITKEWWEGEAKSSLEACKKAGWDVKNCWVRERSLKGSCGWKKPNDYPELGEMKRRFNMEANDVMSEDGKIMILKPRYIKIEKKDSGYMEIKVSLEPKEGYILHPAFKQRDVLR